MLNYTSNRIVSNEKYLYEIKKLSTFAVFAFTERIVVQPFYFLLFSAYT